MSSTPNSGSPLSRRSFLIGASIGAGAAAGAGLAYAHYRGWLFGKRPFSGEPQTIAQPDLTMPGRYPGRVVEVHHPGAVRQNHTINVPVVDKMIDRGMAELTGHDLKDTQGAWGTFFEKGDVVGIKVNPVGRAPKGNESGRVGGAVGAISNPAIVVKIVHCLRELGIPAKDIILFERYADELEDAGYIDLVERELPGVRWMASAVRYTNSQLDITGFDEGRDSTTPEKGRHVAGYDPDVFVSMGYCMPHKIDGKVVHDPKDDRRYRSHLSRIVSRLVNKMITIPVLKDHRSAGITLALKNMSHGMNNNVCRSHLSGIAHGQVSGGTEAITGPNQCNTFIPTAVSQKRLREKATLHLCDGLIGVYEGGPGCWNKTWGTWRRRGLLFATDPVALDHVGWDLIDAKRAEMGWPAVGNMGQVHNTPTQRARTALTTLAAGDVLDAAVLAAIAKNIEEGRGSEVFNLRTPDHVALAGEAGLGKFDRKEISYQRVTMGGPA